ncbi:hypothetical protein CPB97_008855 [Podila verticillata]|nr:hypothetical protein CPB97_008855 [Podila verticillata]
MELDPTPKQKRPQFMEDRKYAPESMLHDLFKHDFGSVKVLPPFGDYPNHEAPTWRSRPGVPAGEQQSRFASQFSSPSRSKDQLSYVQEIWWKTMRRRSGLVPQQVRGMHSDKPLGTCD